MLVLKLKPGRRIYVMPSDGVTCIELPDCYPHLDSVKLGFVGSSPVIREEVLCEGQDPSSPGRRNPFIGDTAQHRATIQRTLPNEYRPRP